MIMAYEVNGHVWEADERRFMRPRDVRLLRCSKCGERAKVYMRSTTPEADLAKEKPCTGDPVSMGCTVPAPVCSLCPPGGAGNCEHR